MNASKPRLACSMLNSIVGVNPTAASYRGTPPLMQDLLGGRVDYTCQQPNGVIGLVQKGDIRALVIADDTGPISLAGVMGGASTEISDGTSAVLLEAAHWEATGIARGVRRHKLPSEAAKRFERGTDPDVTVVALARARV